MTRNLGQVFGLTVRSRSLGGNIAAALKSLVGGEIRSYVKLNEDARRQALDRMVENAAAMGANAVSMMRFDSTEMGRTMSEIVAYGTAQVVEWEAAPSAPHRQKLSGPMATWIVLAVVVVVGASSRSSAGTAIEAPARGGRAVGIQPTEEVFVDPETGRRMRVWYDEDTGRREYRPE